jgi:hypothetical protein
MTYPQTSRRGEGALAAQPFFKGVSSPQRRLLAESALEMKFEAGQNFFETAARPTGFISS